MEVKTKLRNNLMRSYCRQKLEISLQGNFNNQYSELSKGRKIDMKELLFEQINYFLKK